jgi:hypothetical protein
VVTSVAALFETGQQKTIATLKAENGHYNSRESRFFPFVTMLLAFWLALPIHFKGREFLKPLAFESSAFCGITEAVNYTDDPNPTYDP